MPLTIYYGIATNYRDVTKITRSRLVRHGHIIIPKGDKIRAKIFGDHLPGTQKHIRVIIDDVATEYKEGQVVKIPLNEVILYGKQRAFWRAKNLRDLEPVKQLQWLHQHLVMIGGSLSREYPEQLIILSYLNENATVLELGSNIGRSTCVIASVLSDSSRLVTLECCPKTARILSRNRAANGFKFHIEVAALSKVKLAQKRWNTVEYTGKVPTGYQAVNTINFTQLQKKYSLRFDTLVADCEGALYQILRDEPTFLNDIKMIIVENDYRTLEQKRFVDKKLAAAGFKVIYTAPAAARVKMCCAKEFYQVFRR